MEEDERVELIGGELVPMSPKGIEREVVKSALVDRWNRHRPEDCRLTPETTFRLSDDTYLEPDVVIYPRESGLKGLAAANVLLVVEVADSSLQIRYRPQGGALRELRDPRALGRRRSPTDSARLPRTVA